MSLLKKVYDYIYENKHSSIPQITEAIKEKSLDVMNAVEELCKEDYISMCYPEALTESNNNSCYYEVTGKPFVESD